MKLVVNIVDPLPEWVTYSNIRPAILIGLSNVGLESAHVSITEHTHTEALYEELRQAIDGGSESMTHADALEAIHAWKASSAKGSA